MATLLLSGWTQPVDALRHLAEDAALFDYSAYASPQEAIAALASIRPTHCIAWSMGGQLALRAIAAKAIAPHHLTLIAAPAQFVSDNTAIQAMDPLTYQLFHESYARDPARTKARFHGLIAKGDAQFRHIMAQLTHHPQVEDTARWLPWLTDLGQHTLDAITLNHAPPTLIIHGTEDAIVPHAQSEYVARLLPTSTISSWQGCGHAPHLHDPARLMAAIAAHRAEHGVA